MYLLLLDTDISKNLTHMYIHYYYKGQSNNLAPNLQQQNGTTKRCPLRIICTIRKEMDGGIRNILINNNGNAIQMSIVVEDEEDQNQKVCLMVITWACMSCPESPNLQQAFNTIEYVNWHGVSPFLPMLPAKICSSTAGLLQSLFFFWG